MSKDTTNHEPPAYHGVVKNLVALETQEAWHYASFEGAYPDTYAMCVGDSHRATRPQRIRRRQREYIDQYNSDWRDRHRECSALFRKIHALYDNRPSPEQFHEDFLAVYFAKYRTLPSVPVYSVPKSSCAVQ
jgi:hypothetical protein